MQIPIPTLKQVNKELAERSYYEFFLQAWPILEPTTDLEDNWHVEYLCDELQDAVERIARGEQKPFDIIINIPPRTLKSSIVTVTLNAWAWTRWPHLKFIATSYGADLAISLALKTRRLIESPWYHENWGDKVKLTDDQNTKGLYETEAGGMRKSVGVGGAITGSGGDVLIVDDPINPLKAHSEVELKNCITWFKETLYSRLNNQKVGLRIIIMQRLHQEDLTGYVLENQPDLWKHICIPVSSDYEIKPGELAEKYQAGLFFPSRFNPDTIAQAKTTLGTYGFAGQMGQKPSPLGGGIIKTSWFRTLKELPNTIYNIYDSWDCAVKTEEENDYSVRLRIGEFRLGYCILDVQRIKVEYPELERLVKINGSQDNVNGVLVEDKSSGQQVKQSLKRLKGLNIVTLCMDEKKEKQIMKLDKVTRANLVTPMIETGKVFVPENAPWLADFFNELSLFPNGKHDDQVDALTQALIHFSSRPSGMAASQWPGAEPVPAGDWM